MKRFTSVFALAAGAWRSGLVAAGTALGAAFGAAVVLSACGVGTGGTGGNATAYASGPITGFGSVIVGGVRFDDSSATVEDGEGARRGRDDLRLGMTVEIDGNDLATDGATAVASRIRVDSELLGAVERLDAQGGGFTLLGQAVAVDAGTVFDERLAGVAGLRVGQALEVYAVFDAAARRYRATRIEPALAGTALHLRGPLTQIDAAAQTLRIGSQDYSYAGASNLPATLAAGQFVRLRLALQNGVPLRWRVLAFGTALQPLADADGMRAEGLISAFTSQAQFSVNGRAVDAGAAVFPSGSASLAVGVRVDVRGSLRAGVLRASEVRILNDSDLGNRGFEVSGALSAVNSASATITVRGVTFSTARSDLRLDNGTAADLVVGRSVEVRGVLSADRRVLEATRIRFR